MKRYCFIFLVLLFATAELRAQQADTCFRNPLIKSGADPWIVSKDGIYHYCYSGGNKLFIKSSADIFKIGEAAARVVWQPDTGTSYSKELWAPELHFISGKWYIYVAADNGDNFNHRMYVLQSASSDINSAFHFVGKLNTEHDRWAIDGTVLLMEKKLYFIWSGWEGTVNVSQNIYITEMTSPTEIKRGAKRTMLSKPEYEWEKRGGSPLINEGPEILKSPDGKVFLVYSASGSWSDDYCLGILRLEGHDPMKAESWIKYSKPVFAGTQDVISPGHCSFIKIGSKDWIVYHAIKHKGDGWSKRYVKMQPFHWKNGEPDFNTPVKDGECISR